jgi:hypothetical protein
VGHGGSTFGYRSLLTLIPSRKVGVAVLMSGIDSSYNLRGTITTYLLDQALGLEVSEQIRICFTTKSKTINLTLLTCNVAGK